MADLQGGIPGRESWASRLGFVLAAAGSAVGLGNIWRFPYMVGENGGAAFVLLYLVIIILVGYPMMVTEMTIGRKTNRNPVGAFRSLAPNTPWWLVGALGVFTGFVILSYYSVVAGWSLSYIVKMVTGVFGAGVNPEDIFVGHITSTWEPLIYHFVFMAMTVGIIAGGVVKGIQRSVEILMPLLALLLLVMVVRAVTLPGAGEGLAFYLAPDFSVITATTFLDAIAQAFFTLSLGMGAIITYGSYLRKQDEIPNSAFQVVGLDTGIALIAGFAIFPAVFAMGLDPAAGPGLTFITLPAVFTEMPLGTLFGFLFFVLLSIAALTSAISLLEVVTAWLVDEKGWARSRAALVLGLIIFIVGIPPVLGYSAWGEFASPGLGMDILDTYDWFANSIFLPLGGLLTAIFAAYVWGARNLQDEANVGATGFRIGDWYTVLIGVIVPIAIAVLMVWGIYGTFAG